MKFTLTLHYIKVEADPAIAVQIVYLVYEVAQIFAELFALVCNFLIALCLNNLK